MKAKTLIATGAGIAAAGAAYAVAVRPWHLHWGATPEEQIESLPGDEFLDFPDSVTHAITINAPPERVWPWLAQIGQKKGGFYSYTFLENLVGCRMRNADHIECKWQDVNVGDLVYFHPKVPWSVIYVDSGRALVFGDSVNKLFTWGFYLKPIDEKTTRLIVRGRGGKTPLGPLTVPFHYGFMEPAHFIMERKMMLTIKHLVEQEAKSLK